MCNFTITPLGREPDDGDGVRIYRHNFHGLAIRTHRTVRSSPVGWVWGVMLDGRQVAYGYAPTQRAALSEAAHRMSGQCGYVPQHRAEGFHPEPVGAYVGKHSTGRLARWMVAA